MKKKDVWIIAAIVFAGGMYAYNKSTTVQTLLGGA